MANGDAPTDFDVNLGWPDHGGGSTRLTPRRRSDPHPAVPPNSVDPDHLHRPSPFTESDLDHVVARAEAALGSAVGRIADRLSDQLLAAVGERLEEIADRPRTDPLHDEVAVLRQEVRNLAATAHTRVIGEELVAQLADVRSQIEVLRRRLTLRARAHDLSDATLEDIAERVAARLRAEPEPRRAEVVALQDASFTTGRAGRLPKRKAAES